MFFYCDISRQRDAWGKVFASLWLQWSQLVVALAAASSSPFARHKAFLCSLTPSSKTCFCGRLCSTAVAEGYMLENPSQQRRQVYRNVPSGVALPTHNNNHCCFYHFIVFFFYFVYGLGQLPQLALHICC